MAKATKESKTYSPKELAAELEIDPKQLRAYLRRTEGLQRDPEAKNTSWQLSQEQADMVKAHFSPSDED